MESLAAQSAQLDDLAARIRERIPEAELVPNLLGGWTVRFREAMDQETLAARLAGLPIAVAPDERFYAQ